MRSGLLFILTNLLFYISLSQDIVHSSGEYQSDIFPNETFEQGKLRIRESAIINALKKAFGVAVFQGNNLFVSNKESGVKQISKTLFTTFEETYVKGELLETLNEKFTQLTYEHIKKKKVKKNRNTDGYRMEM